MNTPRPLKRTERLLVAMLADPAGDHYVLDLTKSARIGPSIYSVLLKAEQMGWVESDWNGDRRAYRLTPDGVVVATEVRA